MGSGTRQAWPDDVGVHRSTSLTYIIFRLFSTMIIAYKVNMAKKFLSEFMI
jgi:hypothetical protein